jgi:hypothetical protein
LLAAARLAHTPALGEWVSRSLVLTCPTDLRRRRRPVRALRSLGHDGRGAVQLLADELDDDTTDELRDGATQLVPDERLEGLWRRGHAEEFTIRRLDSWPANSF